MTVQLDDYDELLTELGDHPADVLRAAWQEAARVFSPRGLEIYLRGARALKSLGRGTDLVVSFIQGAPEIAREIGEDAVDELVQAALAMASKTSGAVIAMVCATAPLAARRLGDIDVFRGYLRLLGQLLAQAPRGLRPMLDHLETLLTQLTLGGLRRWAMWGAQAHRNDFEAQIRYFGLASPDAFAVLQKERRGTLFVDIQRRIGMYLRALWGRDFFLRPTSGDFESREGYRPYIADYVIHVPDAFDAIGDVSGLELYRAAATHAAAHLAYTRAPLSAEALTPLQIAVIGVIEDARIETLAIRDFPGLKELWLPLHGTGPTDRSTAGLLARLARALLDPDHRDPDPLVVTGREAFAREAARLADNRLSWDVGVRLAHELVVAGVRFNPRRDVPAIAYRDDNRYVWEFDGIEYGAGSAALYREQQVRKHVSLMELVNEVDVETAGDDAEEVWVLSTELFPYEDQGVSYNAREGKEPVAAPRHYPEWDYAIQLERPSWTTVLEKRAGAGDLDRIDDILDRNRALLSRLRHLIEALQPQGVQRLRKQEDGDEIDINAAVLAMTDLRTGASPDPRIAMRNLRKVRDLAVLVLLDLSESANDKVRGADYSVLDLSREATVLLAEALDGIGDPFAIHGFASDGRHDVQYFRFKDFGADYDDHAKARLAGMTAQLSTRMGSAVRHAGTFLKRQPQSKRLLVVVTDGEPADVDVRDPQYLRLDAKKAVEELGRCGIMTYCMSLDPHADDYVARIFGARNYLVVDHVERLPERLPMLYMGLTR
jgi:nitric oxide reductase NorD protein